MLLQCISWMSKSFYKLHLGSLKLFPFETFSHKSATCPQSYHVLLALHRVVKRTKSPPKQPVLISQLRPLEVTEFWLSSSSMPQVFLPTPLSKTVALIQMGRLNCALMGAAGWCTLLTTSSLIRKDSSYAMHFGGGKLWMPDKLQQWYHLRDL